jgi:hypothetical protein
MQSRFFDDPVAKCLQSIDLAESPDLTARCEFFRKLAQSIPSFPKVCLVASLHINSTVCAIYMMFLPLKLTPFSLPYMIRVSISISHFSTKKVVLSFQFCDEFQ